MTENVSFGGKVEESELIGRAVAPRVSKERLMALIRKVDYIQPPGTTLTLCIITTKSGFTFVGQAAAASAENFQPDIGQRISYEDAIGKMWGPEGYLLKSILHAAKTFDVDDMEVLQSFWESLAQEDDQA